MTKKNSILLLFSAIAFIGLLGSSSAQHLSPDMQRLCMAADKADFSPLLESIRSPNKNPLLNGIELGSDFEETTKLLAGRHPDSIVILEATPLIYAAIAGNWPAAKAILNAGADINYKMPTGATPLEMAVYGSQFPIACRLVESGAKIPTSADERSQLMRFAISAKPQDAEWSSVFIEYLLLNGFDVNDSGLGRSTTLMTAVSMHNIPAIRVLLKHGARLDIAKQDGRTVWTVAREKNNPRVLKLLEEAQKKADAQRVKTSDQKELITQ